MDLSIKPILGKKEFLVDRMNYEAVEFIKRHQKEPFFLYLSHYAVHTTLAAKEADVKYFRKKRKAWLKTTNVKEKHQSIFRFPTFNILLSAAACCLIPINIGAHSFATFRHTGLPPNSQTPDNVPSGQARHKWVESWPLRQGIHKLGVAHAIRACYREVQGK